VIHYDKTYIGQIAVDELRHEEGGPAAIFDERREEAAPVSEVYDSWSKFIYRWMSLVNSYLSYNEIYGHAIEATGTIYANNNMLTY